MTPPAGGSRRRTSLAGRHALGLMVLLAATIAVTLALEDRLGHPLLAGALALLVMVLPALYLVQRAYGPMLAMFRALAGTVSSYRDGDFAFSLRWRRNDELGDLVAAHNELGEALREQRYDLAQRELLLDTMVQNTPVAMLLCRGDTVVYANLTARKMLRGGRRMDGASLHAVLASAPALADAVSRGGDGLFAVPGEGDDGDEEDVYHLARRPFRLNGREHELYLLRHLTTELRRQEVRTWKKVIRVISHELNNSLAPMASLAHSGSELVRRGQHERLEEVFATIEDRARHLEQFILGYARFAKLPAPRPEAVTWPSFVERLRRQVSFAVEGDLPETPGWFDPAQLEQALLNLLGNAHESGSPAEAVSLRVRSTREACVIEVGDRGSGMTEAVLSKALLPFYSDKRGGTGLGLALAREIAEAHGGRILLANRTGGGLSVSLILPGT